MPSLVYIIAQLLSLLSWIVIVYVFLTYFLAPYNPLRMTLARFIEPMLAPFRRLIPPISGIDLSPMALIIILQILRQLVVRLFS
ncbi:MAG: YggT family protein [Anaerolineales bacterium]|jgi:YggT family protein